MFIYIFIHIKWNCHIILTLLCYNMIVLHYVITFMNYLFKMHSWGKNCILNKIKQTPCFDFFNCTLNWGMRRLWVYRASLMTIACKLWEEVWNAWDWTAGRRNPTQLMLHQSSLKEERYYSWLIRCTISVAFNLNVLSPKAQWVTTA